MHLEDWRQRASTRAAPAFTRRLQWLGALLLCLLSAALSAAPQTLPLYTAYLDAPLDATSPGNLTAKLADWLSERSGGRYRFVPTQLQRERLDAQLAKPGWAGAVAWAHPRWFDDVEQRRYLWTPAYMQDADIVVSHHRRPVEFLDEGRSLKGLTIATVAGHRLADLDWLISAGGIRRVDARREIDALRLLQQGRVDAALVQAISMAHFRRELPGLDQWLHVASQPRTTHTRHLFTAPGNEALRSFLASQLAALETDAGWRATLPSPPRQLRLVSVDPLSSPYNQALRRALDQAFERAGLRYSLTERPGERAVLELRAGQFDGDITRHQRFGELVPGLLRVEPPHSLIFELAITRRGGPRVVRREDLAGLRVAVPRGFKRVEAATEGLPQRQLVEGVDACVRMVVQGRVDVCVEPGYSSAAGLGQVPEGAEVDVHVLSTSNMYLWLRPGQENEARRLGEALAQMERSGELDQLMGAFRRRPAEPAAR
jgi:polar amino acid transport system substrate-binding protein